jgi:sterol desaturase/sphingolipid hydroxylase (fatty acid hydroxylase superfamily)/uncharacterized membrane protein YhhN
MGRVIVLATPVFLALIALEWWWGRRRGRDTYSLADAVNSVGLGIMSQYTAVFTRVLRVTIYAIAASSLSLVPPEAARAFWTGPLGWVLALLFYDFCYYWQHRISHERTLFWGAHVVHHQSRHYNLSTALRQTSTGAFLGWIFYLPMALAGVPPAVFGIVALVDLLYQFWVHTEHVGRLGWFDRVFVSPSNHRVHHAIQDGYLDRNYGGILVVWDRLFGTFVDESEPCTYGTRKPLDSWDPVWANLEVYAGMAHDAWHARRWRDKAAVLVARTGWRPPDVAARFPQRTLDPATPGGFEVAVSPVARALGAAAFLVALGAATPFLWHAQEASAAIDIVGAAGLTALLWLAGALLQRRLPALLGASGLAAVGATVGAAMASAGAGGFDWMLLGRVCKPLVMGLALAWAVARLREAGPGRRGTPALLAVALAASLAGDVALMFEGGFLPGLVAFLLAHLAYVVLFARGVGPLPNRAALVVCAAFGLAMAWVLWPHVPGALRWPVVAYVAVICTMGAQAIGRAVVLRDPAAMAVAAGAVLFMASDTQLALNRFVAPLPVSPLGILSTYFAAQLLIARNVVGDSAPTSAVSAPASDVPAPVRGVAARPSGAPVR